MKATNPSNEDRDRSILPNGAHGGVRQREPCGFHLDVPFRSDQRLLNHRVGVQDPIEPLQLNRSHTIVQPLSRIFENNSDDPIPISKEGAMMQQHPQMRCEHSQAKYHGDCIEHPIDAVEAISVDEPFQAYRAQP